MKVKYFLTIFFVAIGLSNLTRAQNVNIPDANFKAVLVGNSSINTNGDGEIQISEAATYTGTVNVTYAYISDLTGIEAFTALTDLRCAVNSLTSLDISHNTALTFLHCFNNPLTSLNLSANTNLITLDCSTNQLTSLDVSANTALTHLNCGGNPFTSLNVSANTALTFLGCWFNQLTSLNISVNISLTELYCHDNQLTSLNISANTALTELWCYNNQITSLNVSAHTALIYLNCATNQLTSLNVQNGNNTNFTGFNATNNPNLTCIQVDNVVYSNTSSNWYTNGTASYSQSCSGATGISNLINDFEITIYPNPANGAFIIKTNSTDKQTVDLYDVNGKHVFSENVVGTADIDASSLGNGIYTLTIKSSLGIAKKKLVIAR